MKNNSLEKIGNKSVQSKNLSIAKNQKELSQKSVATQQSKKSKKTNEPENELQPQLTAKTKFSKNSKASKLIKSKSNMLSKSNNLSKTQKLDDENFDFVEGLENLSDFEEELAINSFNAMSNDEKEPDQENLSHHQIIAVKGKHYSSQIHLIYMITSSSLLLNKKEFFCPPNNTWISKVFGISYSKSRWP